MPAIERIRASSRLVLFLEPNARQAVAAINSAPKHPSYYAHDTNPAAWTRRKFNMGHADEFVDAAFWRLQDAEGKHVGLSGPSRAKRTTLIEMRLMWA